jgi:hypothetical protein
MGYWARLAPRSTHDDVIFGSKKIFIDSKEKSNI